MKEKKVNKNKVWPKGYIETNENIQDFDVRNDLIGNILKESPKKKFNTELFTVMAKRRSTRKFSSTPVEKWKIDKILAAADAAPTAGNCQGFEIFYVTENKKKEKLVKAANNQPYVNTPILLVFCMNPSRINLDFTKTVIDKFSVQDATLAAAYSQLAASALGLSSIWIGMFDENEVKKNCWY